MTQGLITLISKPNIDVLLIDNWHPICLLNNDYNIFALMLPKTMRLVMDPIIDETQSGLMSRHIVNNFRLVLDILDYPELSKEDGFIFFLDFYKAFDTGGASIHLTIKTPNRHCNSSVHLMGGYIPRI